MIIRKADGAKVKIIYVDDTHLIYEALGMEHTVKIENFIGKYFNGVDDAMFQHETEARLDNNLDDPKRYNVNPANRPSEMQLDKHKKENE